MSLATLPRPTKATPAARLQADLENAWKIWSDRAARTLADGDPWARYVTVLTYRGDPFVIATHARLRHALRWRAARRFAAPRTARRTAADRAQVTTWVAEATRDAHRRHTQRPDDAFRADRLARFVDILLAHSATDLREDSATRAARRRDVQAVLTERAPTAAALLDAASPATR